MPNVDELWIGVQKVDGKVYPIYAMGDGLTSHPITDNRLTIIRYLYRSNPADFWSMGDKKTRQICLIGVQEVDKMFLKIRDNSTISQLYYLDSLYKNRWTS